MASKYGRLSKIGLALGVTEVFIMIVTLLVGLWLFVLLSSMLFVRLDTLELGFLHTVMDKFRNTVLMLSSDNIKGGV